ncbi:hypothetical protein GCM10010532_026850 [Dactylosporangium siamense]|uniref:Uncharacterized protein n=1 Tax=Dactylosporangium siamense TaxID=685454 RepID=A0A919U9B7_9ACTN|nr:hypothetical protein Dsi01nite_005340 [Dactylosporangium siamense]
MARYNSGPFDSDTAQDLLELSAELTREERLDNLRAVFLGGPRHPDGPFEPVDNTEVVAGAALVARAGHGSTGSRRWTSTRRSPPRRSRHRAMT